MVDEEKGTLRVVAWSEILPWLSIFRTFRLAIGLRVLVMAAVAITLTIAGWAGFDWMFSGYSGYESLPHQVAPSESCPWMSVTKVVPDKPNLSPSGAVAPLIPSPTTSGPEVEPDATAAGLAPSDDEAEGEQTPSDRPARARKRASEDWLARDAYPGPWSQLSRPFRKIFGAKVTLAGLAYLLLCGLWALAVWAFFGGAITRLVAVRLACDERITWGASLRHASSKWGAYMAAPLFPLIGVLLATVPIFVLGLFLKGGFGILLAGIFWPLALLGGVLMAILLLGLIFGWPLMWATISAEGTDSFDALSRSYAYVFQRPLHYLFYAVVAALFGLLGWLLVSNFAAGVVALTYWAASWGYGGDPAQLVGGGYEGIGCVGIALIQIWVAVVKLLAVGFLYSYFWTASTAVYFLLRRDVDATEMDEVFLEEEEDQQSYGLPPLETDSQGAPVVSEGPADAADATEPNQEEQE